MEIDIALLPPLDELDSQQTEKIKLLISDGKLSPEDARKYDGWLTARTLGSQALVGCIGYEKEIDGDTNSIYMQSLVVAKDYRRKGIGKELTNELIHRVIKPGEKLVALTLFWNNTFYDNLGFSRVDAKNIKSRDSIAGREKHKYCTAWVKEKTN